MNRALKNLLAISMVATAVGSLSADEIDFNRDVRQILSDNCFLCHGPAESTRAAGLRLDLRDAAIDSGAIQPGAAHSSELVARIFSDDADAVMPPPESNKTLTTEQKDLLKEWIEQGAEYQDHWAFVAPKKSVERVSGNPVDHFVRQRLVNTPLSISETADPRTLIRRVTFDLTGVPPSIDDVDAFLSDIQARGLELAYERVVDRLLASHAYGERMTLAWLDAARYGDTSVMHADGPRDMWPWRDWVIHAYNSNMPFDQFTTEQLAGDLIPDATTEQKIASGFNRNHATSDEGGAFAEELRVEYVVDRVATTSTVWLGLTMECAQCHDHKYDPISQKEYYQFFAYFNNTADPGMQTRNGNQTPTVEVDSDFVASAYMQERQLKREQLSEKLETQQRSLEKYVSSVEEKFNAWAKEETQKAQAAGKPTDIPGLVQWFAFDTSANNELTNGITGSSATLESGKFELVDRDGGKALKLNGSSNYVLNEESTQLAHNQPFSFAAWMKYDGKSGGAVFSKMDVNNAYRGYDLWVQGRNVGTHIISKWQDDAIKVVSKDELKIDTWQHVVVTYDGEMKAAGVKVYIDGKLSENQIEADSLKNTIDTTAAFKIGSRSAGANWKGEVDDIRIYNRELSPEEVALAKDSVINGILNTAKENRTAEQNETLKTFYLANHDAEYQKQRKAIDKSAKELGDFEATRLTSMIMTDNPPNKMRMTYVLDRGQYDSPREDESVTVGVPKALPALPEDAPANRLGLAQWLTDPQHPLTARVAINRYWTLLFGNGLVRSAGDFGAQGMPPTHPELLDWLAVDFVESGWDVKRMMKTIVMSETYRQSSRRSEAQAQHDPENLLLSRSPRFRLQGEFIRDSALAIGGLLVDEVGGPGVKPYQPPNIWNEVSLNGGLRYNQDSGRNLYRKSMYTYWKRSAPMPNMLIFDAPSREKCVVKRARTNTPLQALVTLNDPQFVEAARAFAQRIITTKQSATERIDLAYQLTTSRPATQREQQILAGILERELARFAANPDAAQQFLSVGQWKRDESLDPIEHAAWTVIAQMILNLDEALTRG
ncbi:DUF1553 domain-containing protein [Stieleria varia]|nr:DUF1553 domain-containing protein [Stieleria varia]